MNTLQKLLRQLSRQRNFLKRYNRTTVPTLGTCPNSHLALNIFPEQQQRRSYAEWAPNIVRSPFPNIELSPVLLSEFFWSKAEKWGDLTALVCGISGRELTYSQLRKMCRRLATSLLKEGYKPGDVIVLIIPNVPEFPAISLGIIEAELVLTAVNPMFTAEEIKYQVINSNAVGIITIPERIDTVLEAKTLIEVENSETASKLKIFCTNDVNGNEAEPIEGVDTFSRLVAEDVDDSVLPQLQTRKRTTNDVAVILYSSGTTGRPKGVCLTHRNLIARITTINHQEELEKAIDGVQEVVPVIVPGFHAFGLDVFLQSLTCGAKVITLPKFEENSFIRMLNVHKCTVLHVAPPLILYIGSSPNVTENHLRSVKLILSGAAPIAESDILKCVKKSSPTVFYKQAYGLTETGRICSMEKGVKKYSTVGTVLANNLVKIVDLQTKEALGPNKEGEICYKGPQVMKEYLKNEKANKEVFDNDGWFHTGDVGYYDNDRHLYITDRIKEIIKVKGFQVSPAELEALLRSHPEVEDAGVIGVPDPRKGETPIGFVKLKKDAKCTSGDLKRFIAPKVVYYKQLEKILFVNTIPKSASGKILRKEIKENYLKQRQNYSGSIVHV